MQNTLHLISFNVPYPANYGGVIDVFYKIKALKAIGVNVILHCFEYGRTEQAVLAELCESVFYYKRNTNFTAQISLLPYIVNSRQSIQLKANLLLDDFPILYEGLHCCYSLQEADFKDRLKIVRMHNIEWQYYQHLADLEANFIKKIFFKIESWRLKRYQGVLENADYVLAISPKDETYLQQELKKEKVKLVYPFHQNEALTTKIGNGDYVLFHGDLSVKDNEDAAFFLIEKVFKSIGISLVIAGLNPSEQLRKAITRHQNIVLKANVPHAEMRSLLENAHINILISFQSAGMKLKLLNALFMGRHCLVNQPVIEKTGVEAACKIANEPTEIQNTILQLMKVPFTEKDLILRRQILKTRFSNQTNANHIRTLLLN